jgi:hypothetical protein
MHDVARIFCTIEVNDDGGHIGLLMEVDLTIIAGHLTTKRTRPQCRDRLTTLKYYIAVRPKGSSSKRLSSRFFGQTYYSGKAKLESQFKFDFLRALSVWHRYSRRLVRLH